MLVMSHPKYEQTLVLIKPDGIQRSLIGEIIKRYERTGLKLVGLKMVLPNPELVEKHYSLDADWRRKVGEKRLQAAKEKGEQLSVTAPLVLGEAVLNKLKKYLSSWQMGT